MYTEFDEFCEIFKGFFPCYLVFILPILIIVSPASPVSASHEFNVYRMQHYDLHGVSRGCRTASLSLEARSINAWTTKRHCIVTRIEDLATQNIMKIKENAGGLLIVLPKNIGSLTSEMKELFIDLEMQLLEDETSIPIYFVDWSPHLENILSDIENSSFSDEKEGSALEAILQSFTANGYRIVVNANRPTSKSNANIISIQGKISGFGLEDKLPTIAIVSHFDTYGGAPDLSYGADSNGSGVIMLLELARIFSHLYSNSRTHAQVNILFLLSGGGKFNYQGSKKWLEDQLEHLEGSLLQDAMFVLCLDTVSSDKNLYLHVSKPPKDGSPLAKFYEELNSGSGGRVEIVHKKINLADEILAWEHERYSIRRLPAATISGIKNHKSPLRGTMFDLSENVNVKALARNIEAVASALARQIYNVTSAPNLFTPQMVAEEEMIKAWLEFLTLHSRSAPVLCEKNNPLLKATQDVLSRYLEDVKFSYQTADKRDPEFVFYDSTSAVINIYNVKPAVFDLFLSIVIAMYLGVVFLAMTKLPLLYTALIPSTSKNPHQKKLRID